VQRAREKRAEAGIAEISTSESAMDFGLEAILESAEEDCDELSDCEEDGDEADEQKDGLLELQEDVQISAHIASTAAGAPPPFSSSQNSIAITPSLPVLEDGEIVSPSDCLRLGMEVSPNLSFCFFPFCEREKKQVVRPKERKFALQVFVFRHLPITKFQE
jgi:hypothetical protein